MAGVSVTLAQRACAWDDGDLSGEPQTATVEQAASLPPLGQSCTSKGACSVYVVVPQGAPETQIALSATGFVHVNDRATVTSLSGVTPVAASVSGWSRIGVDAQVGDFLSPYNYVQGTDVHDPRYRADTVSGDLFSAGGGYEWHPDPISQRDNRRFYGAVESRDSDDSRMPRFETHTVWSFQWPSKTAASPIPQNAHAGTYDFTPNQQAAYGNITVDSGVTVVLKSGTYFFNSLTVNAGGKFIVDTSSKEPVRLAVAGSLTLNDRIVEQLVPGGAYSTLPSRFLLAYVGSGGNVNANKGFEGVMVAPGADLSFWWDLRGAAFGRSVEIHQEARVRQGVDPALLKNPAVVPSNNRLPDDKSIRYVERLGYLDGRSCDHWPLDLKPRDYVATLNASLSPQAALPRGLTTLGTALENTSGTITVFGSQNELVVTSYEEYSAETKGLARRMVAVDPSTKRGYDLSHVRLCRETADLQQGKCAARSVKVLIDQKIVTIDVFGRKELDERRGKSDEPTKAVQLVSPLIRFEPPRDPLGLYGQNYATPNRVEFDVNLVVSADKVQVGTAGSVERIELEVRPYAAATPSTWLADLDAQPHVGILAVLAGTVSGFSTLATFPGVRAASVRCYPPPPPAYSGQDSLVDPDLIALWDEAPSEPDADNQKQYITRTHRVLHVPEALCKTAGGHPPVNGPAGFTVLAGDTGTQKVVLLAYSLRSDETYASNPDSTVRGERAMDGLRAAQIYSDGLLFQQMQQAAESESLLSAEGIPSTKYVRVAAMLDQLDSDSTLPGVALGIQGRVRALADSSQSTSPVRLNALGMPYGALAKPWLPNTTQGGTGELSERTLNELLDRWKVVGDVVEGLDGAMKEQATEAELSDLDLRVTDLAKALKTYATSIQTAAVEDQLGQAEANSNLNNTIVALDKKLTAFQQDMCRIVALPATECSWDRISAEMQTRANTIVKACEAKHVKSDGFFDTLTSIAKVCPYIGTAVAAFDKLKSVYAVGEKGEKLLKVIIPKGKEAFTTTLNVLNENKKSVEFAGNLADFMGKASSVGAAIRFELIESECPEGDPEQTAAVTALMSTKTAMAVVDSMALQAQTIRAVLESVGSTISYQLANEQANEALKSSAAAILAELSVQHAPGLNGRAQRIAATCSATRLALRSTETELLDLTHRIQTSSGTVGTTALAIVPAGFNGPEFRAPFVDTLWDGPAVERWVQRSTTGTASLADAASQRLRSLVGRTCSSTGDYRKLLLVRKTLTGEAFARFKSQGFARFSVGFSDLVESGRAFASYDYGLSGVSYVDLQTQDWHPVTAPVVYGTMFAPCTGTEPGAACCAGDACRVTWSGTSPSIVRGTAAWLPTTQGCSTNQEWSLSPSPVDLTGVFNGSKWDVRTCLVPVQTSALAASMARFDGDLLLSASYSLQPFMAEFCNPSAGDLTFSGLRGTPLFGDWTVAANSAVAAQLQRHQLDEVDGQCDLDADVCDGLLPAAVAPNWWSANASATGMEVVLIVGAEPLVPGAAPVYQESDYRNEAWRQ